MEEFNRNNEDKSLSQNRFERAGADSPKDLPENLSEDLPENLNNSLPDLPAEILPPPDLTNPRDVASEEEKFDANSEATGDSIYLNQLKYTPEVAETFLNFFIQNFRVIILAILILLTWGIFSFKALPLESNPEVKIPFGIVSVTLPGASPSDMEELVVRKIEDKIVNIEGVKTITSSALNSAGVVSVEFRADQDLKDAIRKLRDAVSNLKSDLPTDASDPVVNEVSFDKTPVWTINISGPYDNFTLRKYSKIVQDELKKLAGASDVTLSGGDVREIRIIYSPSKLQSYSLSIDQVNGAIKAANLSLPLGKIEVGNFNYTVKTEGKFVTANDIRELPVLNLNDKIIKVSDVANVVEMARERDVYSSFSLKGEAPQNGITLNVIKKTGSSIIDLIDGGKVKIEELKNGTLPKNLNIETTFDISKRIRTDFDQLTHDGLLTIILVSILLFLFVGLKEAFVAGLAVPMVFCVSFGIMLMMGLTLNFLSVFSLIIALGLLVDDAIVVVQATKQYLKTGKFTPEEAVLLVFKDYKVVLFATTLTTIWAFVPLLLATGIIGQFIRSIPLTVGITLAASFFVAILINHPMAIILERFRVTKGLFKAIMAVPLVIAIMSLISLITSRAVGALVSAIIFGASFGVLLYFYKTSLKEKLEINDDLILQEKADDAKIKLKIYHHYLAPDEERSWFDKAISGVVKMDNFLPYYGRFLDKILSSKLISWAVLIGALIAFFLSALLPATGILKSEFIPPADSEYMYINLEGAPGLVTKQVKAAASQVEKVLLAENTIKSFSEVIGASGVNVSDRSGASGAAGSETNKGQFAINFYPLEERPINPNVGKKEKSYLIAARIREAVKNIKSVKVEVVEVAGGPPSGADIEARLIGKDLKILEEQANRYKNLLASIDGVVNAKTSLSLSPGEFVLNLDQAAMARASITSSQVALNLRTALSGVEISKIIQDGDEIIIRGELDDKTLNSPSDIMNLTLPNGRGSVYNLSSIAKLDVSSSVTVINRKDQKRVISVTSSVTKPHLPAEILTKFQDLIKANPLPSGYEVAFGGQNETNTESILSILRAMVVAMILIVSTLVIQFNSFRKAVLVLATIPLAMTGVFVGLTVFGFTLSFPGLIGILALFGIVVKNAVILVDKINLNLKVGIAFKEAIIDASKSRLEAIFLTSICTIIGMIPITLSNETWQGLGASLIFGLSTSTFLTLAVIPTLFYITMKGKQKSADRLAELRKAL